MHTALLASHSRQALAAPGLASNEEMQQTKPAFFSDCAGFAADLRCWTEIRGTEHQRQFLRLTLTARVTQSEWLNGDGHSGGSPTASGMAEPSHGSERSLHTPQAYHGGLPS